jgi:hypothetical protein
MSAHVLDDVGLCCLNLLTISAQFFGCPTRDISDFVDSAMSTTSDGFDSGPRDVGRLIYFNVLTIRVPLFDGTHTDLSFAPNIDSLGIRHVFRQRALHEMPLRHTVIAVVRTVRRRAPFPAIPFCQRSMP